MGPSLASPISRLGPLSGRPGAAPLDRISMRGSATLLGLALILGTPSYSQTVNDFKPGTHTFGGTTLPFRLFIPKSYRASEKYPLILFLHGAGERGSDNTKPVSDNPGALIFARDSNQAKHPAFILAPQCPAAPNQWVDAPWSNGNYVQDRIPISNELRNVVDMLDSLLRAYSIDTNRLYAVGSSMGGFGTWDIVTRYPKKFAATIPVVGAGDPSKMALIAHMGIWAHHGDADPTVPVSGSRNMMKTLDGLGWKIFFTNCDFKSCLGPPKSLVEDTVSGRNPPRHIYSEYKGLDHGLWSSAYSRYSGLADWLFSFSKQEATAAIPRPVRETGDRNGEALYDPAGRRIPLLRDGFPNAFRKPPH
jgi:predicted peptidase